MHKRFSPAAWLVVSLGLGCACIAHGQAADTTLTPTGAVPPPTPSLTSSGAAIGAVGPGSVDASALAGAPFVDATTQSSVSNVYANGNALSAGSSGKHGRGIYSSLGDSSKEFNTSSKGWGGALPQAGLPGPSSAQTAAQSGTARSIGGNPLPNAAHGNAGGKQLSQASLSAISARYPVLATALAGQKLDIRLISANLSAARQSTQPGSEEDSDTAAGEAGGLAGRGAGAMGTGSYSLDFPDSTKNTALINPPDLSSFPILAFDPEISHTFPDLLDYEFLKPTLRLGEQFNNLQRTLEMKEDLYRRIQRRLSEYKQGAMDNGLKTEKGRKKSTSGNPFEQEKMGEDEFKKPLNSGLSSSF
jgi:hypothetical protein